jgi:hypothetical protein
MAALKNWIADMNRFGLAKPPDWWLQRLHDFDNQLVIIPSRQQALYRIARRKQFSPGVGAMAVLDNQRDTGMLAFHGLVPVTTMIRYADSWDIDSILQKLRDRDMWALSGGPMSGRSANERAERVWTAVEGQEQAQEQQERARQREDLDYRSRDAWRSYQARTGQRSRPTIQSGQRNRPSSGSTPQEAMGDGPRIILATS